MEGKFLITTDNWFYAPDGLKYRSVWGEVKLLEDNFLGVKTNRNSSNWYAYVGSEDKGMIVAGCQIHYAVKCKDMPNDKMVQEVNYGSGPSEKVNRQSEIYIAE